MLDGFYGTIPFYLGIRACAELAGFDLAAKPLAVPGVAFAPSGVSECAFVVHGGLARQSGSS
jgi:hypothetical protein